MVLVDRSNGRQAPRGWRYPRTWHLAARPRSVHRESPRDRRPQADGRREPTTPGPASPSRHGPAHHSPLREVRRPGPEAPSPVGGGRARRDRPGWSGPASGWSSGTASTLKRPSTGCCSIEYDGSAPLRAPVAAHLGTMVTDHVHESRLRRSRARPGRCFDRAPSSWSTSHGPNVYAAPPHRATASSTTGRVSPGRAGRGTSRWHPGPGPARAPRWTWPASTGITGWPADVRLGPCAPASPASRRSGLPSGRCVSWPYVTAARACVDLADPGAENLRRDPSRPSGASSSGPGYRWRRSSRCLLLERSSRPGAISASGGACSSSTAGSIASATRERSGQARDLRRAVGGEAAGAGRMCRGARHVPDRVGGLLGRGARARMVRHRGRGGDETRGRFGAQLPPHLADSRAGSAGVGAGPEPRPVRAATLHAQWRHEPYRPDGGSPADPPPRRPRRRRAGVRGAARERRTQPPGVAGGLGRPGGRGPGRGGRRRDRLCLRAGRLPPSLDLLRRNGWKGHGPVPWEHEATAALWLLALLAISARAIGETEEWERCLTFCATRA